MPRVKLPRCVGEFCGRVIREETPAFCPCGDLCGTCAIPHLMLDCVLAEEPEPKVDLRPAER